MENRRIGKVLRFESTRGWGFIQDSQTGANYFIHYSNIISEEKYKNLEPYERVYFNSRVTSKGQEAYDVEVVKADVSGKSLTDQLIEANKK